MRLRRETICNCCLVSVKLTNGLQNHLGWGTKSTEAADVRRWVRKQGSRWFGLGVKSFTQWVASSGPGIKINRGSRWSGLGVKSFTQWVAKSGLGTKSTEATDLYGLRSQILQEFLSLNVLNPVVTTRLIDYRFLGINSHTTNCLQRCNYGQESVLQNLKIKFSSHSIQWEREREREREREGTSGAHTAAAPNNTQNQNPTPRRLLTFFSLPKLSDCCSFLCCSRFLSLRHHIAAY